MTEEEIKALQDAKVEAERRASESEARVNTLQAELDTTKAGLNNIVEELKTERQKKNEALAKLNINTGEPDVTQLIEQALQTKDMERRKTELEQAIAEFKSSKPEFQSDAAGLVFGKFQEKLKMFNLTDLSTKDQVKNRLEEIYRFANFKTDEGGSSDYEGTPSGTPGVPDRSGELGRDTQSAIATAGIDQDRFKTLKDKYPEALTGLGIQT